MNSDVAKSLEILQTFERKQSQTPDLLVNKSEIREALGNLREASDSQIFGVLADSYEEALHAIHAFSTAFHHPQPQTPQKLEGPVYLKYNPSTQLCYCDEYSGDHRGVLVSFQSDFADGINEMIGYVPLNLYQD